MFSHAVAVSLMFYPSCVHMLFTFWCHPNQDRHGRLWCTMMWQIGAKYPSCHNPPRLPKLGTSTWQWHGIWCAGRELDPGLSVWMREIILLSYATRRSCVYIQPVNTFWLWFQGLWVTAWPRNHHLPEITVAFDMLVPDVWEALEHDTQSRFNSWFLNVIFSLDKEPQYGLLRPQEIWSLHY